MSAWGDMMKRGAGENIRGEDFSQIYYDNDSAKKPIVVVEEKEYKDYQYKILTTGDYPSLDIRVRSENTEVFGGYSLVVLKFPDKSYELDRMINPSPGQVRYVYTFNKDGDYIHNTENQSKDGEGHKYTVQELEEYAKKFIDKIIQCDVEFRNELKSNVCENKIKL